MAFYGCDFTFDGKRASTILEPDSPNVSYKRLMLYNIGSYGQDDVDFSVGEIAEDRINRRYDSLLYGLVQNEPLQFTLVFGIDPDDLHGEVCFTRAEISKITQWLTGHQSYKILTIDQQDMAGYRYHAMVTGLKLIASGGLPTAFSAEITCDSPYAYIDPLSYRVNLASGVVKNILLDNQSTANRYYYPVFTVTLTGASYIQFVNVDDGTRTMKLGTSNDPLPSAETSITVDCQNQIITASSGGGPVNLYPGFNMKFLRILPGNNVIEITTDGSGTVAMTCEFPVNIGA